MSINKNHNIIISLITLLLCSHNTKGAENQEPLTLRETGWSKLTRYCLPLIKIGFGAARVAAATAESANYTYSRKTGRDQEGNQYQQNVTIINNNQFSQSYPAPRQRLDRFIADHNYDKPIWADDMIQFDDQHEERLKEGTVELHKGTIVGARFMDRGFEHPKHRGLIFCMTDKDICLISRATSDRNNRLKSIAKIKGYSFAPEQFMEWDAGTEYLTIGEVEIACDPVSPEVDKKRKKKTFWRKIKFTVSATICLGLSSIAGYIIWFSKK